MANHTNRNPWATVKVVDRIRVERRLRVIARHRTRENLALTPTLKRMQNGKRQRIIDIIAHVRIKNNRCPLTLWLLHRSVSLSNQNLLTAHGFHIDFRDAAIPTALCIGHALDGPEVDSIIAIHRRTRIVAPCTTFGCREAFTK